MTGLAAPLLLLDDGEDDDTVAVPVEPTDKGVDTTGDEEPVAVGPELGVDVPPMGAVD